MTLTVIIPTYNRPECVARNLAALRAQEPRPDQIIIIDASPDDRTQSVVSQFPEVLYVRSDLGRGNVPAARNLGFERATGEIIAMLDDDAFPRAGWAAALLTTYEDPSIDGVAGRSLNGVPGEEKVGLDAIGKFTASGKVLGNFAADPGRVVDIDHQIGCNMSFRAPLIAKLGGFRDDFRVGPFGICEESDFCVRAKRAGARFVFQPLAVADHIGAVQPGGRRFSPKYSYQHARNNLVMVIRNYGPGATALRNVGAVGGFFVRDFAKKVVGATLHVTCGLAGLVAGFAIGLYWLARTGRSPIRQDDAARALRERLDPRQSAGDQRTAESPTRRVLEASV